MNTSRQWRCEISPNGTQAVIVDTDGATVAEIRVLENSTAHSVLPALVRLIVAAPDMWAALQTIAEVNPYDTSSTGYIVTLAKSAIARANGETV